MDLFDLRTEGAIVDSKACARAVLSSHLCRSTNAEDKRYNLRIQHRTIWCYKIIEKVDQISFYILCLPSQQVIVMIDEVTCVPCRYTQSL